MRKVVLKEGWSLIRVCVQGDLKDRVSEKWSFNKREIEGQGVRKVVRKDV